MARRVQLDWIDQGVLVQPMRRSLGREGRVFSDTMVVVRSRHHCSECEADIEMGDRVRARVELDPRTPTVRTLYACVKCCAAMAERSQKTEAT